MAGSDAEHAYPFLILGFTLTTSFFFLADTILYIPLNKPMIFLEIILPGIGGLDM